MSTSGRSFTCRRRQRRSTSSPCMRSAPRIERRRSGRRPVRAGRVRRVRRRGGVSRSRDMIRRIAASSSGVQAANDLCRSVSTLDAMSPSVGLRLVLLAGPGRLGRRDLQDGLGRARGPRREPQQLLDRVVLAEEVGPEHLVVGGDVVAAGDQRGPPAPVQVDEVGRVEGDHRRAVGRDVARADGHARRAQRAPEVDQDADQRRVAVTQAPWT